MSERIDPELSAEFGDFLPERYADLDAADNDALEKFFRTAALDAPGFDSERFTAESAARTKPIADHYREIAKAAGVAAPTPAEPSPVMLQKRAGDVREQYRAFYKKRIAAGETAQDAFENWKFTFTGRNPEVEKLMFETMREFA